MSRNRIIQVSSLAFLLAAFLFVVRPALAGGPAKDSDDVSKLLSQVKSEAIELQYDTSIMESFTRSNLAWESHSGKISQIKEHVNNLGKTLTKLNDARNTASPWQEQAIDRITPLMKDLAENVSATIRRLDENKNHLQNPEYKDYLLANHEMTTEVVNLVSDYVEYGKAKAKVERLAERLETPSGLQ